MRGALSYSRRKLTKSLPRKARHTASAWPTKRSSDTAAAPAVAAVCAAPAAVLLPGSTLPSRLHTPPLLLLGLLLLPGLLPPGLLLLLPPLLLASAAPRPLSEADSASLSSCASTERPVAAASSRPYAVNSCCSPGAPSPVGGGRRGKQYGVLCLVHRLLRNEE